MKYFLGLGLLILALAYASTFFVSKRIDTTEVHPVRIPRTEMSNPPLLIEPKDEIKPSVVNAISSEREETFSEWSRDELLLDQVHDFWGEVIQESFFNEERVARVKSGVKVSQAESSFLKEFKDGVYRGFFLLVPRSNDVALDPQPVLLELKKNGKKVKLVWISWKKSTNADGSPYVHIKEDHVSMFESDDPYTNTITFSNRSLTAMFLAYFGGPHDCKEGTLFISSERSKLPQKIEGDLYCRLSRDNFILTGLVSMSLAQ